MDRPEPTTYGELLDQALGDLHSVVDEVNEALDTAQITDIVARSLARELKKRGSPTICAEPDGTMVLLVGRGEPPKAKQSRTVMKGKWSSDLPSLDDLRDEAAELGVDISDLNRKKRAIFDRLSEAKSKLRHMDEVGTSTLESGPNGGGHVDEPDDDSDRLEAQEYDRHRSSRRRVRE